MNFVRSVALCAALVLALPMAARSDEASGTLAGTVQTVSGAPIAHADVTATGPTHQHVTTDNAGHFTITLPAGIYRLDVNHGGYSPAELETIAVLSGGSQPLTVILQQADLSTLRTIGRVSTSRGSSINTGASAINITPREEITNYANPQINDIVQRIPGASLEKGSTSPNTSISLGGAQPYETQVLIDGHPVSAGRYGVWFSQFFNSFLVGNIETQVGPGNTTALAGTAVGGTANLVTPGFTTRNQAEAITGIDSWGSQYSSVLGSGRLGKLAYVLGAAYSSNNGAYAGRNGCILNPGTKSTWDTSASNGIIQFCGSLQSSLFSKGEITKFRYDFSPSTSFEVGYIGSQAGYLPQASTYGVYAGQSAIQGCIPNVTGNGPAKGKPGSINGSICTSPTAQQYVGQKMNGYFFYPGSNVYNNQPLFTAQLRTTVGDNTLLIRPYAGNIARIIDGSGEAGYAQFWYPSNLANNFCTGNNNNAASTSGNSGIVGPTQTVNGQSLTECYNSPFSVLESDKLKGNTLSFIHPMGDNLVTFTYDFHTDETFAYYNTPSNVAVPDTLAHFNQLSVTGQFGIARNLDLKAGLYDSIWALSGTQTGPFVNGKPTTIGLSRKVSNFDPHLALTLSPSSSVAYRLAYGTSTSFPYASQVSGNSVLIPPSGSSVGFGTLQQKNPALAPERSYEFDLGLDKRFGGTIVSLDLFSNQVKNVFETLTSPNNDPATQNQYSFIQQPLNAATLNSKFAMLTVRNQPNLGFGYYATATLARSIVQGIPLSFYPGAGFAVPANDIQQCSDGGSNACVPYFKAYARAEYRMRDKTYLGLGVDIEGKNNTYFQPPFALFDFTGRRPINDRLTMQVAVQNLLNTNAFSGLVQPNSGVAMIGENKFGQYGPYAGGNFYGMVPAMPRTVRFQLDYGIGKQP